MDKLALILALAAAGLSAYAAFGTSGDTSASYDTSVTELAERISALEAENERYRALLGPEEGLRVESTGEEGQPVGTLEGRAPRSVPARVAALEEKLAAVDQRMAKLASEEAKQKQEAPWRRAGQLLGRERFLTSLDQAEKVLGLDAGQRAQFDRIIESTKSQLETLYATPNDEGQTLKDLMKPQRVELRDGADGIVGVMGNFAKIQRFKRTKVPGTNETYAEAEKRIREAGKRDARGELTPEQHEKWDKSHTDALFGPGVSGGVSIAFGSVFETDDG